MHVLLTAPQRQINLRIKVWRPAAGVLFLMILAGGVLLPVQSSSGQPDDFQLIAGLRNRQLFHLAETYCLQRLSNQPLDPVEQSQLTIELIRTYVAKAVNSPTDQRAGAWQQAHQTTTQFERQFPRHPRLVLVQVQDALTYFVEGQVLRQGLEFKSATPQQRTLALERMKQCTQRFESIDQQITKTIPQRRQSRLAEAELSADQLIALQKNVRYHLARAYRNRAMLFEDRERLSRLDALGRVLEQHGQLVKSVSDNDPLWWKIQIDRVICLRLLQRFQEAQRLIDSLPQDQADRLTRLRLRAEQVELALAQNQLAAAQKWIEQGREDQGITSPELDYAWLTFFLRKAAEAEEGSRESSRWQEQAVTLIRVMEQQHGSYWQRRANRLLLETVGGRQMEDLDLLIRIADQTYQKGELDDAIVAYETAADQAGAGQRQGLQFRLLYKAALIEHERKNHAAATERLCALGLQMPRHPQAATAHLLGVWNEAQQVAAKTSSMEDYAQRLQNHLATWPQGESADQARLWLGRIHQFEKRHTTAVDILLDVPSRSPHAEAAIGTAASAARAALDQRRKSDQPTEALANLLAGRFEARVLQADGSLPQQWTAPARLAVLEAARLRLDFSATGFREVDRLLSAALAGSPQADASWKQQATLLLIVAMAAQDSRRDDAIRMATQIQSKSPRKLFELTRQLARVTGSEQAAKPIAELQLHVIQQIAPLASQLAPQQWTQTQQLKAEALAKTGQMQQSLQLYRQLAQQHPRDGDVQEGFATLLGQARDQDLLQEALVQWRRVVQGSKPQSDRWFRAKFHVASTLHRLGKSEEAYLMLRYLKETPPGWQSAANRQQLDRLLKECKPNN